MSMLRFAIGSLRATILGRQPLRSPAPAARDTWVQAWRRGMAQSSGAGRTGRLLLPRFPATAVRTKAATTAKAPLSGLRGGALRSRTATPTTLRSGPARRKFHSTRSRRASSGGKTAGGKEVPEESLGFSARIKKLSREYGWVTVGVYAGLTILDFPFCFLLVRWVGTEKIAEAEHWVVSNVSQFIPAGVKDAWHQWRHSGKSEPDAPAVEVDGEAGAGGDGWGVKEADERNKTEASLGTQLALAYAIHKSFIFVRVPLTAAITPRVVKILRGWGYQIGKRRPKP